MSNQVSGVQLVQWYYQMSTISHIYQVQSTLSM